MTGPSVADYADPITIPFSLTITLPEQPGRSGMSRLRPAAIAIAKGWPYRKPGE